MILHLDTLRVIRPGTSVLLCIRDDVIQAMKNGESTPSRTFLGRSIRSTTLLSYVSYMQLDRPRQLFCGFCAT